MIREKDAEIFAVCKEFVMGALTDEKISPEMVSAIAELIRTMMEP